MSDPHRTGHRAFGAGSRAGDPHPARLGHPPRRVAVPRRPRQVGVPRGLRRRRVLRRPGRALRAGAQRGADRPCAPRCGQRVSGKALLR
ncbi:hypothetical protein OF001_U240064 [Pseudomonas sp. OF001]|nr:hypothetical protein OF001_U240064 [Pseudomonas sp. OF001]